MADFSKITSPSGTEYTVKDETARNGLAGKLDNPSGGTVGQVLTKTANGEAWQTPSGGSGSVDSVNNVLPDANGNVDIDATDIPFPVNGGTGTVFSAINALSESVAPIETGTASQSYAVGDYLLLNGQFCKVTAAIAIGESLTVGTNITATDVGTELVALSNGSTGDTGPVVALIDRWLRFDPNNKKGLIIKAGTHILKDDGTYQHYDSDTAVDLTSDLGSSGTDYFVYLANDGTISAGTSQPADTVKIGRFHTLCANVGTPNMILPSGGITASNPIMVKSYKQEEDPDFYAFYRKTISSVSGEVATVPHPLSGFNAGDILPESVFCLTFHPDTLVEDAMVYDKDTDRVIDVYLQSGKGVNTRSAYNATHIVSRQPINHQEDMRAVGKKLLTDHEFTSAAIGSNEKTNITGSADKTYVGGHVDTANRRMISAIGCEEMCGYLWQWLDEIAPTGGSGWNSYGDGDNYGQSYGMPYGLRAGGHWGASSDCGSRSRTAAGVRSSVYGDGGGRGSSRVCRWR